MRGFSRVLIAGFVFLASAAPLHALDFKDGRWRVTIETETRGSGMAGKVPPKYQYEHCLTQKDFKPDLMPLSSACRTTDAVTEGDEISWKFACRERGTNVHGHGKLIFSGTRFRGTLVTISEFPRQFEVLQKLSGRYLGTCRPQDYKAQPRPPVQLRDYDDVK